MNIALRRFLHHVHNHARQKKARSRDYALLLFWMTSRVLYSAQYHRQHCTLQAFQQFGALCMYNLDDKYLAQLGLEPNTSRLQDPVDTSEPSKTANNWIRLTCSWFNADSTGCWRRCLRHRGWFSGICNNGNMNIIINIDWSSIPLKKK